MGNNRHIQILLGLLLCGAAFAQVAPPPPAFTPADQIRIACGSATNVTVDTRTFQADSVGNTLASGGVPGTIPQNNAAVSYPALLSSARFFTTQSTYTFKVTPGRHWIRLYFYPFASSSFNPNNSFFSVDANQFRLLDNFSAVAVARNTQPVRPDFFREYTTNVTGTSLVLTFTPQAQSYAFVNAIEIVSQPNDLIKDDGQMLGSSATPIPIGLASSALQTMFRLNVGGTTVSPSLDSTDIGRTWMPDADYIFSAAVGTTGDTPIASIQYPSTVPE